MTRDPRDVIVGKPESQSRYGSQVRDCQSCGFSFVDYDDADRDLCDECATLPEEVR